MDCDVSKMPKGACVPARIQSHRKDHHSYSSSLSYDPMPMAESIPSPRRWSPTYQPRRRSRQFPTLSFVPSPAVPRPEAYDHPTLPRRPADRGPVCVSPFRSVRRMKEPFQLVLPSSPASCDSAPTFPPKSTRQSKPLAGHTLRTWRSDQNLTSTSMTAFGLLPSPPISEFRPASTGPGSSYFECKDELEDESEVATPEALEEPAEPVQESEQEEKIHYQAYHPPGWNVQRHEQLQQPRETEVTNVHQAHSKLYRQCEPIETQPTATNFETETGPSTSPVSVISARAHIPGSSPRIQRPRTATVSSEASWIPSNLAYCETWLKGVPLDPLAGKDENFRDTNRRKVQIVEQDPPMPKLDIIPRAKTLDEPLVSLVMI